jgi:hypothetical protein
MALHTQLPIHKLAYDLLGLAVDLVRNMPRDVKATLGSTIRDECLRMLLLIAKANAAGDKVPHITALLEARETVELLLRTCHDKRFISHAQWARAVELTESIGKQAGGWRKQSAQDRVPEQPSLFSAAAPAA